jgi:multiple antibiotic resistance protein
MPPDLITFGLSAFATIFAIVDPFATAPIFLAITPRDTRESRGRMALLASVVSGGVLLLFTASGNRIFAFFGISAPAFRVAGGILLLATALDTLRSSEGSKPQTPEEKQESVDKPDVAITPLAIPLLAGPGAISTVALLGSQARNFEETILIFAGIILTAFFSWVILSNSTRVMGVLGRIGLKIVTRIMGLLLAGMGVQFILMGVREFWGP